MGIVAIRARHLSDQDGVSGNLMNLRALLFMADEADFGLGGLGEYLVVDRVHLVAIRASHVAALMLASGPVHA